MFKEIPDSNGYLIGSDGVVISRYGKILSPRKQAHGYTAVVINGKNRAVHRLVALAFLGEPPPFHEVHHLDNDKKNNDVTNLKWVSRKENMKCAKPIKGEKHHFAKLRDSDVRFIRRAYASKRRKQIELALQFDVHPEHIGAICRRQKWKHLS